MSTFLNHNFNEWVHHWMINSLNDYFTEWILHWMSTSLNEYFTIPLRLWPYNMQHFETKKNIKSPAAGILWSFFNNFTFYSWKKIVYYSRSGSIWWIKILIIHRQKPLWTVFCFVVHIKQMFISKRRKETRREASLRSLPVTGIWEIRTTS